MQKTQMCGMISTNQRWLMCPCCGKQKLARLAPTSSARELYLFCKRCNREVYIPAIEPEP